VAVYETIALAAVQERDSSGLPNTGSLYVSLNFTEEWVKVNETGTVGFWVGVDLCQALDSGYAYAAQMKDNHGQPGSLWRINIDRPLGV